MMKNKYVRPPGKEDNRNTTVYLQLGDIAISVHSNCPCTTWNVPISRTSSTSLHMECANLPYLQHITPHHFPIPITHTPPSTPHSIPNDNPASLSNSPAKSSNTLFLLCAISLPLPVFIIPASLYSFSSKCSIARLIG
jgi:hypothetical protein